MSKSSHLARTARWITLLLCVLTSAALASAAIFVAPVSAQAITNAFVRGTDVALHAEPTAKTDLVATLQKGDAIRITGDAETASGDRKSVTVDTLGVTQFWFVPIEVLDTGDVGWIAELYIDPHRLDEANAAALPETPVTTPSPTATAVPTPSPVPTAVLTATPMPNPEGAVDRAKAWMDPSCEDGIGRTFTTQESVSAPADDDAFTYETSACSGAIWDPVVIAQCGPPMKSGNEETARVVCLVDVMDVGVSNEVVASAEDFSLLSNTGSYGVNREASRQVDSQYDITSQPVVVPDEQYVLGLVAFDVPAAVAAEDLVLQWTGIGPIETEHGTLPGLQVLVHDREPEISEAFAAMQTASPGDVQSAEASLVGQSFTGTSDDVIGPLTLEPGLYQVSASFTGEDNFAIWVRQSDGSEDLLVNEIDSYRGDTTFTVETAGNVVIEVEGVGSWAIQIEQLM